MTALRKQRTTKAGATNCFLLFIQFGNMDHGIASPTFKVELSSVKPLQCLETCLLAILSLGKFNKKVIHCRKCKWLVRRPIPISYLRYFNILTEI